jgi:subtilisin-like proprotein convertase family protein
VHRSIASVATLVVLASVLAEAGRAQTTSTAFSNQSPILINDRPSSFGAPPATATPYPSTINVTGVAGTIAKTTVTLRNLSHARLSDLDVLVVAPSGQGVAVLSDVNGINFSNSTFTFDDTQAGPADCTATYNGLGFPGGQVTFGSSNCAADEPFPSPAPSPSASALPAFNGSSPNGAWRLYVVDDATGELGQIAGGWTVTLSLTPPPDVRPPNTTITAGPSGRTKRKTATFRFRSSEARSRFRCRLDNRRWASCTSPRTYRALRPGRHTFRVAARDRAGNLDPTPAVRRWRITTPPKPAPTRRCEPGYSPCLPIVGDLDCDDVRAMGLAPVRVTGSDRYRLDGDNDGWGCE